MNTSKITLIICMILVLQASRIYAQKLITNQSDVSFFSEAPLENISAKSNEAKGILDQSTGEFLFRIPITSFHFENELMEEHFNENYMESDKYPLAIFKGKIDPETLKIGMRDMIANGILTIHGVDQECKINVKTGKEGENLLVECQFDVALADHDIDVPTLLFQKIADTVSVSVNIHLIPLIRN
tara:strand:- start:310 stop:864 length:555 start_codon:yes stop_codon:yes gene_type:complete